MHRRSIILAAAAALAAGASAALVPADAAGPLQVAVADGKAPGFVGITRWLNSEPLTLEDLRGKVVMVTFWTYGCYNCVNTLPHVTQLYEKYKDQGFVVVGVHTPEFPFERSTANVATAIKRHGIAFPVAQDNDYATWKNYGNRYWPAQYIIDKSGRIVFTHAGEGDYDTIERTVRRLLGATT